MQIYMNVCISLLCFKYLATLNKTLLEMKRYKMHFPKLCFRAKYILFRKQKIKVKNFIVVVSLLNVSYTFHLSFFLPFSMPFFASLAM